VKTQAELAKQLVINENFRRKIISKLKPSMTLPMIQKRNEQESQINTFYKFIASWQTVRLALQYGVRDLLSPSKEKEDSDEMFTVCCVCFGGESRDDNPIVFCEQCNMSTHKSCYGIPTVPDGDWYCDYCQELSHRKAQKRRNKDKMDEKDDGGYDILTAPCPCTLCPVMGGALKPTDDGRFAHIVCGLWTPHARM
jgi:hypothetical protein